MTGAQAAISGQMTQSLEKLKLRRKEVYVGFADDK